MTITFTSEQQDLLAGLRVWKADKSPEAKAANLAAFAGCGKTTVLSYFVQELVNNNENVIVVAPTHAALSQLKLRINAQAVFKTVSAAIGQIPFTSNTSCNVIFFNSKQSCLKSYDLVVVDESSMLSEKEIVHLIDISNKVVFLGDAGQLAPVKKKPGTQALLAIKTQFCLTKVMRSNDVIAAEAIKARTIPQYIPQSSPCGSIVCHDSEADLLNAFYAKLESSKLGEAVWISHTNAEVCQVNSQAHYLLTGRSADIAPGDSVRLGTNCLLGKNNEIVEVLTSEKATIGFIVTTQPEDGTAVKVNVALPEDYATVAKQIESIVALFKKELGSKVLEIELNALRAIVPVDFIYSVTTHKSQGASIRFAFANSQKLVGQKSFYVAYSRASEQLNCCKKITKTKGYSAYNATDLEGETMNWVHKSGLKLALPTAEALNAQSVRAAILTLAPSFAPSVSHIQCVLNPAHASKSAKGWSLVP